MVWQQIYDPFGNMVVSTLLAAVPVVVMLGALGLFHIKAHVAADSPVRAGAAPVATTRPDATIQRPSAAIRQPPAIA